MTKEIIGCYKLIKIGYFYNMERITVNKFETDFNKIIKKVKSGTSLEIISEKEDRIIGYFLPPSQCKPRRKLGILAGKAKVVFASDFKITEEEFLGWKNK